MSLLRAKRFERGLTIAELASAACVSRHTIMRLEAGTTQPQAPTAKALADTLGCVVADLWPAPVSAPPQPEDVAA